MLDISTLNTSQLRVVRYDPDKHILCVAGPGSGKTRTMTYRIGYLALDRHVPPSRLRAVTFSRAATQEMQERLDSLDNSLDAVQVSTIHSLCRYIIGETQNAVLRPGDFRCYIEGNRLFKDQKPEKAVLEAVVRFFHLQSKESNQKISVELNLTPSSSPGEIAKTLLDINDRGNPKEIIEQYIQYQKVEKHCSAYINDAKLPNFSYSYAQYVLQLPKSLLADSEAFYEGVYEQYCEILTEWKLLDFTDQTIYAHLGLLSCTQRTRENLQSLWDVLAVDEFQDVDAVQFEVFRLLCAGKTKLNAVGDPDQAIYGFRGGDARFISEFESWYSDAEILKLDTNYRSSSEIIDVAYSAVDSIEQAYRAKGVSSNGIGGCVGYARTKEIGQHSDSVGVLAWTNKTLNDISKELLWNGVVCSVNTRWSRRLNVPIAAYRLVYQTLRALGMVTGKIGFDRDLFLKYAQGMKGIGRAVEKVPGANVRELRKNAKLAGFIRFLESIRKLDTAEIVSAISRSDHFPLIPPEMEEALSTLDFTETYDELINTMGIKLYTIHRSKGLEFDTVFVQTGDFSKKFVLDNPDESKRLLFVALSRAKQNLFLLGGEDQGNPITAPVVQTIDKIQESQLATQVDMPNDLDIPDGMPLTNRLDLMNVEQGVWAIRNGDAWITYLKEQRASGADVKLVEHNAKPVDVSEADKYQAKMTKPKKRS